MNENALRKRLKILEVKAVRPKAKTRKTKTRTAEIGTGSEGLKLARTQ
jgi:hypothetical protein